MWLLPGHPALLLLAGILGGATAQDPRYRLEQPEILAAPTGGSITLPCTLIYPPEIELLREVRVYWRRGGFHGDFVYNHTEGFTRWDYRGRIALVGNPGERPKRTASIRIDRLQASDTSEYVCQVCVQLQNGTWIPWRALPGTRLTVTEAASTPHDPRTKQAPMPAKTQLPAMHGTAPVIGGVLAGAVLLAVLIGLAVCRAQKRTGCWQKPPLAGEQSQLQAEGERQYMEIPMGGPSVSPPQCPLDPQEPGLLYTVLAFAEPGNAPGQPKAHGPTTGETLYSAVRVC
nr:paired immunoglobulin-like type 2 receptor beta isoform X1 [Pelodiscus sinensis]|eukprot:XP_025042555.1 paired immunoglobulin-like type 2 receptor beta isoform X1 [Pelodiscus sinensis]